MKTETKLFWYVLAGKILILALFLIVFGSDRLIWSDSTTYIKIGRNIFAGRGVSDSPLDSADAIQGTTRTLFYPLILGFFEKFMPYGFVAVSLLQAFAAAGIAVLVYRLGRLYLERRYALGAALFVSFEPLISTFHMLIMPDTFLVLFLLFWMWFLIKHLESGAHRELVISIVFLALAVYTKPIAYYLFIITAPVLWIRHRSFWKPVGAILLLFLLFLPWMAYNKVRAGTFAMTTDDVENLCSWELVALISTRHRLDSVDWLPIIKLPEYQNVAARCTSTGGALAIFIREYPKELFVATGISKLAMLTNEGYSAFFEKPAHKQIQPHHNYLTPPVLTNRDWPEKVLAAAREMRTPELMAIIVGKVIWLSVAILAILGFWQALRGKHFLSTLFLLLFVLYIVGVTTLSTGFGVGARLRFPIDPLLAIFAAVGIRAVLGRYTKA